MKQPPPEMTVEAVSLGIFLAFVFGSANAYLGMKAKPFRRRHHSRGRDRDGALHAFRLFVAASLSSRTSRAPLTSVGEALVAGAIFRIPAFMMVDIGGQRLWTDLVRSPLFKNATLILLVGGLIGVFFIYSFAPPPMRGRHAAAVARKRRQLRNRKCVAKPAASKAPRYIFGALGFGGLIEILTDDKGMQIFRAEPHEGFLRFPRSASSSTSTSKRIHWRCHALRQRSLVDAEPVARAHRHRLHHRTRASSSINVVSGIVALVDFDPAAAVFRSRSSAPHRHQRSGCRRQFGLVQRGPSYRSGHHASGRRQHDVFDAGVLVEFAAWNFHRFRHRGSRSQNARSNGTRYSAALGG